MRQEINMKPEERSSIDLEALCNDLCLNWFSYKEDAPNAAGGGAGKGKGPARVVYFIHEVGLTTGVKFHNKRDMAQIVLQFSIHRMGNHEASFVGFAGLHGCRLQTTMSEAARKEVQRRKAALESMKEASAAGEMTAMEAGVAPVQVAL